MVLKGLYSLHGDTLGGLAPALTYTQGKTNYIDCWFEAKWSNGTPSILNGGKTTCASAQ